MSAAQRAVGDINSILERMEVPLQVKENNKEGKHVVAKSGPLKVGDVIFEEVPIVCWPFSSFPAELGVSPSMFCGHCLRRVQTDEFKCPDCDTRYCSAECQARNRNIHSVLCGLEAPLREFHVAEEKAKDETLPIGVESIARCVAHMFIRYLSAQAQNPEASPAELFDAASTAINRFIEPPRESEFTDIEAGRWCAFLRATLQERMLSFFETEEEGVPTQHDVVDAMLSDATLKTLLGQLLLNAQALSLINPAPKNEESGTASSGTDSSNEKKEEASEMDTYRITTGGGLYTIQSCFNHSCQPNAAVVCGDNHEIKIVVLREIQAGEPVNITYISQLFLTFESATQRRERLASYFFTCDCPKCLDEDRAAAEAEAEEKKKEVRDA